jgi:threonine synthase
MGVMIHLLVLDRLRGPAPTTTAPPPLAIASCGNAALGAAVVAAAADRALEVFVPPAVEPGVRRRLVDLGALVRICPRRRGEVGDPCYLRYREAVAAGAVPFATQGPENGLTLEGGATLGYELADQLAVAAPAGLDRLFVQIGGGALASSVVLGLRRAVGRRRLAHLPRLVAVQSAGAAPLVRAFRRTAELVRAGGASDPGPHGGRAADDAVTGERAIDATLVELALHRSRVMWPWEEEPASLAGGILDDETYDWRAVVGAALRTGGTALTVTEEQLADANRLVRAHTAVDADPTGTAGVAGVLALPGDVRTADTATDLVLLTGVTRR